MKKSGWKMKEEEGRGGKGQDKKGRRSKRGE
jgi:hypothetical protein